jgi:hypothetical protein
VKIPIFKLFAVVNFIHQKCFYSISVGLVTFLLSIFVPGQLWATPETAVDFSQTNETVSIDRTDSSNPNVLRTVTSRCPEDGFVVAIANGGLRFDSFPVAGRVEVAISLSRSSIRFDENHQLAVSEDFFQQEVGFTRPVSIQRADRCRMGNSITYRFLAVIERTSGADAFMVQPSLIVMFFRDAF